MLARFDEARRDAQVENEARAHRRHVKGRAAADAERTLDEGRTGRERVVRGRGRDDDQVDVLGIEARIGKGAACCLGA